MKCRTAVALGAALGCFLASGCGVRSTGPTDPIVIAIANSPVILDPRIGTDEASQKAHQLLYSSLFRIAPDLRVVPELAESVRAPGRRHLRHPDSPRGAVSQRPRADRRGCRLYLCELSRSEVRRSIRCVSAIVRSVTALEPYTVRFTLKQPSSSFLVNLVMGIVQDGSGQANVRSPIGSGPYQAGGVRARRPAGPRTVCRTTGVARQRTPAS